MRIGSNPRVVHLPVYDDEGSFRSSPEPTKGPSSRHHSKSRARHGWHRDISQVAKPKIFAPVGDGGDWRRNAVVGRHDDHAIAMGFAETADLIVQSWLSRGPNDLLFEPLIFNYRHAFELVLKAAIRASAGCLRADGSTDGRRTERGALERLAYG